MVRRQVAVVVKDHIIETFGEQDQLYKRYSSRQSHEYQACGYAPSSVPYASESKVQYSMGEL
jgi:hypothetical protein